MDLVNKSWFSALTWVCAPCVYMCLRNLSPEHQPDMKPMSSHYTCMTALKKKRMKSINTYTRPLPCPAVSLCYVCVRIWCWICGVSNDFPRVQLLPVYLAVCLHQGQARLLQDKWPQEPDTTTRRDGLMPIVTAETFYVKCGYELQTRAHLSTCWPRKCSNAIHTILQSFAQHRPATVTHGNFAQWCNWMLIILKYFYGLFCAFC